MEAEEKSLNSVSLAQPALRRTDCELSAVRGAEGAAG